MTQLPLTYARLAAKDPTRTTVLRAQFCADLARRFKKIRKAVLKAIVEEDVFGLKQDDNNLFVVQADTPGKKKWIYRTDAKKVTEFKTWIDELISHEILEVVPNPLTGEMGLWTDTYIMTAYRRGMAQAQAELERSGIESSSILSSITKVGGAGAIAASFNMPIHKDTMELIFTRVFTDLEGITENMAAQMSRILSVGIAEGRNPLRIAREIIDRIDGFPGIKPRPSSGYYGMSAVNRAKLLARTEVIRTYNMAKIKTFEYMSHIVGEPVLVRWITANDERVRDEHRPWHNQVYTLETAIGMLGAPNCRCTVIPYVESLEKF